MLVAGAGFVFNYLSYGISTGNWGWKAIAAGGIGAGMAWVGYNTCGLSTEVWAPGQGITSATWNQVGNMAVNAFANQIMPPIYVPISDNFGISMSPGFGIGATGLTGGMNVAGIYSKGDFSWGVGFGAGDNYWGVNVSATQKGVGGGYGLTFYGNATGPDLQSNAQRVANVTAIWRGGSFTFQNDMRILGGNGDRWRTNALELTLGNFSIGSYIYTNAGEAESIKMNELAGTDLTDDTCLSPIWGKNRGKYSTWTWGETFSAPVWVGYRQGNQIQRVGYSFRGAQDFQQNGIHKYIGRQNFYTGYNNFKSGFYSYSGYYNPFSLWGY